MPTVSARSHRSTASQPPTFLVLIVVSAKFDNDPPLWLRYSRTTHRKVNNLRVVRAATQPQVALNLTWLYRMSQIPTWQPPNWMKSRTRKIRLTMKVGVSQCASIGPTINKASKDKRQCSLLKLKLCSTTVWVKFQQNFNLCLSFEKLKACSPTYSIGIATNEIRHCYAALLTIFRQIYLMASFSSLINRRRSLAQ